MSTWRWNEVARSIASCHRPTCRRRFSSGGLVGGEGGEEVGHGVAQTRVALVHALGVQRRPSGPSACEGPPTRRLPQGAGAPHRAAPARRQGSCRHGPRHSLRCGPQHRVRSARVRSLGRAASSASLSGARRRRSTGPFVGRQRSSGIAVRRRTVPETPERSPYRDWSSGASRTSSARVQMPAASGGSATSGAG